VNTAPALMRAAIYGRFGPPEVVQVEETAKPAPGPDDVLIAVHTSTVSAADYRSRGFTVPKGLRLLAATSLGFFRPRRRILGMDVAGVVETVGENVTKFAPGDEVIALLGAAFGGHAEYALKSQHGAIALKPRSMNFDEAITLVFGGLTAHAFFKRVDIKPGDTVLVNGASGAVGTAAVQLAKQAGARVTAVCSEGNAELVAGLGADRVIDYATTDFTAEPAKYDVIVDCVGNAQFTRVEASLKPGGALLLVITDLKGLLTASMRSRRSGKQVVTDGGKSTGEDLAHLVALADAGLYKAVIDRTFGLADIVEAHRFAQTGRKRGNVVLRLRG
jgi:NADPH:quinone reductase-like Zn-dependent oxidoreductase